MKKFLITVFTLLAISSACFAGCTKNAADKSTPDDNGNAIVREEDKQDDGEQLPAPPPCERCRPHKRHGGRPVPMPMPSHEPKPEQ